MKITILKAFRDIKLFKVRTILMLAGLTIGIASVGAVLSAYSILDREMPKNFMSTNPASMVFTISNLDERVEDVLKETYPNIDVDIKKTVQARISRGDGTYGTIFLRAIRDFSHQAVDTFTLEKGNYPTAIDQITLERDCLKILKNLKAGTGEAVSIQLPGALEKKLIISATVHAPGLAPASMENYSYGFVTLDTLKSLGYTGWYDEVRVVSKDNRLDQDAMNKMAVDIENLLADKGYTVSRVDVPAPGKHPHADQLSSLLFLLQAFAVISLLAACLIIINLLSFIMSRQTKQIAIQKAVGGKSSEIAIPYFLYIIVISLCSIVLSLPLSLSGGYGYASFAAGILNFKISSYAIPIWVYIVQILVGILIPILAAAKPIIRSCAISVKDGLNEKAPMVKQAGSVRSLRKFFRFNTATALPLTNLLRKKSRTVLAILALVAGGILFMTAQNMVVSIDKTTNLSMDAFRWDYDIRLAGNYSQGSLTRAIGAVSGLEKAEIWQGATGLFLMDNGTRSPNYQIKIAPLNTEMTDLPGLDSGNNIIINQGLAGDEKWITTNRAVMMQIGAVKAEVTVLQIVNEVPALPTIYISSSTYSKLFGIAPRQMILASANTHDVLQQRDITRDIEARFKAADIEIAENWNIYVLRKAFVDHLKIIVTFLSVIAMLAVAVGGLGISSTIGINISERRYETGVLRAIGANTGRIYSLILAEVLMMGLIGWLAGTLLSYPVSILVGNYFGQIFLHTDLNNTLSLSGSAIWLAISISVALLSGFIPAYKAANSPLREMLSYE